MPKFTITLDVERLTTALRLASQALDKTLTGTTLFGTYQKVLVEPDSLGLKFSAVNLDFAAQIIIASYHFSIEDGDTIFPFSIERAELLILLQKLKGKAQVTVEYYEENWSDKLTLTQEIASQKIEYSIPISGPDNFPAILSVEKETATVFTVSPNTFKLGFDCVSHVKRTSLTGAKKATDLNPTEGVRLRISKDKIDFTTAVNVLVVKWHEDLPNIAQEQSVIFSTQTIAYILQTFNAMKGNENWTLSIADSRFTLERLVDGMIVYISANSVPGTYPDVEQFWGDFNNCLRINRKQLLASVERAACFSYHDEGQRKPEPVRLKVNDKVVVNIPKRFNEIIPCDWLKITAVEEITFGFNCSYLMQVLLATNAETITWKFNTQSKPVNLHCEQMSAILMPTLLKEARTEGGC